jgi:hypothetical protein
VDSANWITVSISAAAAVAAILAALFAGTQSRAAATQASFARKQYELAELVRKDQAQPYVFADIRPDTNGFLMMLVVENTGPTVARNVRVTFDPPLRSITFPEVETLRFLREGIKALPPGRRIMWYFDTGPAIFENDVPKRYQVTVSADGPFGPSEEMTYEIDFTILEHSEARDPGRLKDITEQLKKTNNTLTTLARKLDGRN